MICDLRMSIVQEEQCQIKAIGLSEYIAAFENGEIVSYCAREVDDFVAIIVILFARSNKSMTILRKQIEIRDIEGIRNLSLESRGSIGFLIDSKGLGDTPNK